jgi:hypothetical protein
MQFIDCHLYSHIRAYIRHPNSSGAPGQVYQRGTSHPARLAQLAELHPFARPLLLLPLGPASFG